METGAIIASIGNSSIKHEHQHHDYLSVAHEATLAACIIERQKQVNTVSKVHSCINMYMHIQRHEEKTKLKFKAWSLWCQLHKSRLCIHVNHMRK